MSSLPHPPKLRAASFGTRPRDESEDDDDDDIMSVDSQDEYPGVVQVMHAQSHVRGGPSHTGDLQKRGGALEMSLSYERGSRGESGAQIEMGTDEKAMGTTTMHGHGHGRYEQHNYARRPSTSTSTTLSKNGRDGVNGGRGGAGRDPDPAAKEHTRGCLCTRQFPETTLTLLSSFPF
ncbi:hypothetical protein M422DRAFT_240477 [Sphaerobolus stellatus SS14]|nr:hypothetical protein M422DRAFT_240477 [Sphaerobolus stellatus SS14]